MVVLRSNHADRRQHLTVVAAWVLAMFVLFAVGHSPALAEPAGENEVGAAADAKTPDDKTGGTRFDSKLRLMVYQLVEPQIGLPHESMSFRRTLFEYRFLGITPTRDGKGIAIPNDATWAVHPQRPKYTVAEYSNLIRLEKQIIKASNDERRGFGSKPKVRELEQTLMAKAYRIPIELFDDLVREIKVKKVPGLLLSEHQASDEQLRKLKGATNLKSLVIRTIGREPRQLDWIGALKQLKSLAVYGDDEHSRPAMPSLVEKLGNLTRLKRLHLHNVSKEHSPALARLSRCRELQILAIGTARSSESEVLTAISNLQTLRHLYVGDVEVKLDELALLAKLPKLRRLKLDGVHVTPAERQNEFKVLARFPALAEYGTHGLPLRRLIGLKRMEVLDFDFGTPLNQGNAHLLHQSPNLRVLKAEVARAKDLPIVMSRISECSQLERLTLHYWEGKITYDLWKLHRLKKLRRLEVPYAVTDLDLKGLRHLSRLEDLTLGGDEISEEGLRHLSNLPRLTSLTLRPSVSLTTPVMAQIGKLSNLRSLSLQGSDRERNKRSIKGAFHLKGLTKLERLDLASRDFSDDDAAILESFTNLRTLHLDNTAISIVGLKHIVKLPNLTTLMIGRVREAEQVVLASLRDSQRLGRLILVVNEPCPLMFRPERWKRDRPTIITSFTIRRLFPATDRSTGIQLPGFPSKSFPVW